MHSNDESCYRGDTAETLAWKLAEIEAENKRLQAENKQLRATLESAACFIFLIDENYRIHYLNKWDHDDNRKAIGSAVRDHVTAEDADVLEAAIRTARETGVEQILNIRSKTSGRVLHVRYSPLIGDDKSNHVVGVSFDNTEDHDARVELQQSKERIAAKLSESDHRFRILVETSPVPVVISDLVTGQVLCGNQSLADTFKTPYETLEQQVTSNFYYDPEDRKTLLASALADSKVRGDVVRLKDSQGNSIWAAIYLDQITYQGNPALLAFFLDVSQQKLREEEIMRDRQALRRLLDTTERDNKIIAYEIHDGAVQDMTGAQLFLESALSKIDSETIARAKLDRIAKPLGRAISEMRRILNGLRPLSLEQGGIVAAIEDIVAEMGQDGFHIEFRHDLQFDRIAPSLEMAIYRTIQEGLNNAKQHSQATGATVDLFQNGTDVRIIIVDEGIGFDVAQAPKERFGLVGIRERARLLGGRGQIFSTPGQGTRVETILPIGDFAESEY